MVNSTLGTNTKHCGLTTLGIISTVTNRVQYLIAVCKVWPHIK